MMQRQILLALALGTLVVALYLPTVGNGFINLDDDKYIAENPQVLRGLTGEGVLWALTSTEHGNWYPLRRLSHLVDASLFGMWAGGHHLVSALWHAGAAALLFLALRQMTGALWRSFAVAGLFAAHPLQVESVAWAAERSNVQAGFFFALTLLLWARYVRRPGGGRYAAALAACALGLAAKPTLVPLPLLLLLLDFWPLGRGGAPGGGACRLSRPALRRLVLEKAPLVGLAAASAAIAVFAHRQAGGLATLEQLPGSARLGNTALSYWRYLGKLLWPGDLAVYYPHPGRNLSLGLAVVAGLGLAVLTAIVLLQARRRPWLAVGWLWYLGMLVPMSGIVQFGSFAMADRFAYLPSVGFFALLVWSAAEVPLDRLRHPAVPGAAVAALLAILSAATLAQARLWRDNRTLYAHALAATSGNWLIHNNLGAHLSKAGERAAAMEHFRESLRIMPEYADTHYNLGALLAGLGEHERAMTHLREAVRLDPGHAEAHEYLGFSLAAAGRAEEAARHYRDALAIHPADARLHNNLGVTLRSLNRLDEAAGQFREALRLRPDYDKARENLEKTLAAARDGARP